MNKKQLRLRRARQTRIRVSKMGVHRLSVHRTNMHIYAQIFSPCGTAVLASASTVEGEARAELMGKQGAGGNIAAATLIGKRIAEKAKKIGIESVAFDRSGFRYHGRVKAVAEAARAAGLRF